MSEQADIPALIVQRGAPSDVELAALVAVLAFSGGSAPTPPRPRSLWGDPAFELGRVSMPTAAAWTSAVRSR